MRRHKQQQAPMDFSLSSSRSQTHHTRTPHSAFEDHSCIILLELETDQTKTKNKKRNNSKDYLILIHIAFHNHGLHRNCVDY